MSKPQISQILAFMDPIWSRIGRPPPEWPARTTFLGLGVIFVMSLKPGAGGSLTALGVALVLGFAAGFPAWSRGRRAVPVS